VGRPAPVAHEGAHGVSIYTLLGHKYECTRATYCLLRGITILKLFLRRHSHSCLPRAFAVARSRFPSLCTPRESLIGLCSACLFHLVFTLRNSRFTHAQPPSELPGPFALDRPLSLFLPRCSCLSNPPRPAIQYADNLRHSTTADLDAVPRPLHPQVSSLCASIITARIPDHIPYPLFFQYIPHLNFLAIDLLSTQNVEPRRFLGKQDWSAAWSSSPVS
jgi:hypothetical protein